MKVSELTGAALDYWVCRAELHEFVGRRLDVDVMQEVKQKLRCSPFWPSLDWRIGGQIIEREGLTVRMLVQPRTARPGDRCWMASYLHGEHAAYGTMPLEAAMRSYVKSKFGDEVPNEVST